MKENLEVQPISLKQIVENLDKIPNRPTSAFGESKTKLSVQEKKELLEKISKFNEYGKVLRCETAIAEMASTLDEIGRLAETYALTEDSGDILNSDIIKRDFKQIKGNTKEFQKLAKECYGKLQQLNALFEGLGHSYSRYFEISSLDEIAQETISNDQQPLM